jgi:hypothetical protein
VSSLESMRSESAENCSGIREGGRCRSIFVGGERTELGCFLENLFGETTFCAFLRGKTANIS